MLATLNDFLLPVFLFVVYFCAASVMLCPSKKPHLSREERVVSETIINREIKDSSPTARLNLSERAMITGQSPYILYVQADQLISNLNKRQSRKLCKPLGIQQKCGKVEKSLTFIKAEIRSLFKDEPERVIAAIQEKLPELICYPRQASEQAAKIAS